MAVVPDQLAASMAILAEPAVARWTTRKKLLRVVELAVRTVGSCDAASVTLLGALGLDGEVCTNAVAYRLDQSQQGGGGGPCLDAVRSLQIFNVACISSATSWPEFRVSAAENGIRSSLSVPLTSGGVAIGMLNLSPRPSAASTAASARLRPSPGRWPPRWWSPSRHSFAAVGVGLGNLAPFRYPWVCASPAGVRLEVEAFGALMLGTLADAQSLKRDRDVALHGRRDQRRPSARAGRRAAALR